MEVLQKRHIAYMSNVNLDFVRDIMDEIDWNDRLIAVRGQRGVGKTTLLLQRIMRQFGPTDTTSVLYVSLDNLYFSNHNLLDFIEAFHAKGGKYLFMDEVHKYQNWSREVKNAYDEFADMHFVITGSSLINILNAGTDLSRRCISYNMQGLSFREYLGMFHGYRLPKAGLDDILGCGNDICAEVNKQLRPLQYFHDYLAKGYYPFLKEGENSYYTRIENMVNLTLETELPMLCGVDYGNVRKLKSLLGILASGFPMSIDTVKLAKMTELSRNTLLQYLQHLDSARIICLLYSDNKTVKRMQKPDKVYLENTNLLYALSQSAVNIGTLREVFFVNQLGEAHTVEYSGTQADFTIDGRLTFEVGGRSKDGRQIGTAENAFIAADDEEYVLGNKIPLWLFGFLY